jgi:hypothetical protein
MLIAVFEVHDMIRWFIDLAGEEIHQGYTSAKVKIVRGWNPHPSTGKYFNNAPPFDIEHTAR